MLGGDPLGKNVGYIMLSLLKACKVTMVGTECNSATFNIISRRSTPENCSFKDYFQNTASKMAKCSIADIVNYLMLLLENVLKFIFNFFISFH